MHIHDDGQCCECDSKKHCCCDCPVFGGIEDAIKDKTWDQYYGKE